MDAFGGKLELQKAGFRNTIPKAEGRPAFAPAVLLKLYLYGKVRSTRKLEKECGRNTELQWLLKGLQPNYHTIADFRKAHAHPLPSMFKLYVHFLDEAGLLGKTTIGVDGPKFKAVNSKKNNYNQKKIDKHQKFIEDKAAKYLQELDELDKAESFRYEKAADSYTCPAGAALTSLGTWHNKKGEAAETSYRFKTYRTEACKTCALGPQCTKLPKRIIQRSEYQDAVDRNDNNIRQNPQYYKRRQAICEHPFGTIKRHWGYTHTLLKGLGKVAGEMNLIMLCYNFLRTKNIPGFEKMLQVIQNWIPDYTKVTGALKRRLTKLIGRQNEPSIFLSAVRLCFLKTLSTNLT